MEKEKLIVLFTVIILIGIALSGCTTENNQNIQENPERTVDAFVERINDNYGEGVVELTDIRFLNDSIWNEISSKVYSKEDFYENLTSMKEAIKNGDLKINSYEIENIIYLEDMDEENKSDIKDMIDQVNESKYYDGNITDLCKFNLSWDVDVDDNSPLNDMVKVVKNSEFLMMYKIGENGTCRYL
ncbi:MAG: hypothetical protein ACLFVB_05495 [Thermoplasmata archaeon]